LLARFTGRAILIVAVGAQAGACRREAVVARQGDLVIFVAYAHPSAGDAGAAYFGIRNAGSVPDTLLGVAGPDSSTATLMGTAAGRMTGLSPIVVGPGERVTMHPGGIHVMLSGLKGQYNIGDSLRLTLNFARSGAVRIAAPVVPFGEMPE
jgi:hypothetical protein